MTETHTSSWTHTRRTHPARYGTVGYVKKTKTKKHGSWCTHVVYMRAGIVLGCALLDWKVLYSGWVWHCRLQDCGAGSLCKAMDLSWACQLDGGQARVHAWIKNWLIGIPTMCLFIVLNLCLTTILFAVFELLSCTILACFQAKWEPNVKPIIFGSVKITS